jgi:hypothetical protein
MQEPVGYVGQKAGVIFAFLDDRIVYEAYRVRLPVPEQGEVRGYCAGDAA